MDDECMDEWMHAWMTKRVKEWTNAWVNKQMNKHVKQWMDGWMDGWMHVWVDACMGGWNNVFWVNQQHACVNAWVHAWTIKRTSKRTIKQINRQTIKRTNAVADLGGSISSNLCHRSLSLMAIWEALQGDGYMQLLRRLLWWLKVTQGFCSVAVSQQLVLWWQAWHLHHVSPFVTTALTVTTIGIMIAACRKEVMFIMSVAMINKETVSAAVPCQWDLSRASCTWLWMEAWISLCNRCLTRLQDANAR